MNAQENISRYIDQHAEQILEFLKEFIHQKSINPDRALPGEPGDVFACQEWLRDQMRNMGIFDSIDFWEVEPRQPNLVGVIEGPGKVAKSLMFNGHADVVPVTELQYKNWTIGEPWKASRIDDRIYGRGAADMKSGVTAFLWGIRALRDENIHLSGRLLAAVNIGEESANFDAGSRAVVRRGHTASFMVNTEPTNLEIYPATMGAFFFKVTVFGKGAHVAYNRRVLHPSPYGEEVLGVNAILKAKRIIDVYEELNQQWGLYRKHPLTAPGSMNAVLVSVRGGEYLGSVPDHCELIYLVWFNANLHGPDVMDEIRNVLENLVKSDYWLKDNPPMIEMPYFGADKNNYEPIDLPVEHPGCAALTQAYRDVMNREPVVGCFSAVCDANAYYEMGIPAILFGPGDLSMGTHAENEYVPVDQVISAAKIYANMAIHYLGLA